MNLATSLEFSRAFVAALRDSTQTEQLLVGEEISSIGRMPKLISLMTATAEGRAILAQRPVISTKTTDFEGLRELPEGSLGRAYAEHLRREGLDPDALTLPVTRGDEVSNYLLQRVRQTHDIWHAVLGLGTAGHEEVLVHTFQWPQLRMPYSALVGIFGTAKHVVGEGRWRVLSHGLRAAYRAGRHSKPLLSVYWEQHWAEPLEDVRQRLRVVPAQHWL